MTSSQLTATSSLEAIAVAGDAAARAALHTLNVPGRQRHSKRARKAGPKFRHATAPPAGAADRGTARLPRRYAGQNHARTPAAAPRNQTQRPTRSTRAVTTRNAANT
jgi:hypothetical protein